VIVTVTVTANCDPPPDSSWLDRDELDALAGELEDAMAASLLNSGAGFSIEARVSVDL
jgi:hypothetical protein